MVYQSPCHPCEYNYYSIDEFGECREDVCNCPQNEKDSKCWIVQWAREKEQKNEDK